MAISYFPKPLPRTPLLQREKRGEENCAVHGGGDQPREHRARLGKGAVGGSRSAAGIRACGFIRRARLRIHSRTPGRQSDLRKRHGVPPDPRSPAGTLAARVSRRRLERLCGAVLRCFRLRPAHRAAGRNSPRTVVAALDFNRLGLPSPQRRVLALRRAAIRES